MQKTGIIEFLTNYECEHKMGQDVKYCTGCIFFSTEEVGEVSSSKNWCRDDMHAKLYIWPHEISIKSSETYELPQTHNSLAAPATSSIEEERSHLTRIWISNSGPQIFCVWAKDFFMSDPQIFFCVWSTYLLTLHFIHISIHKFLGNINKNVKDHSESYQNICQVEWIKFF